MPQASMILRSMGDSVNSARHLDALSHGARVEIDGAALVLRASYRQIAERWQTITPVQENSEREIFNRLRGDPTAATFRTERMTSAARSLARHEYPQQ